MATSSPILFRYLKQSAIVFSGEYTLTGTWSIEMTSIPALNDGSEYQNTRSGMPSSLGICAWLGSATSTACGTWVVRPWCASAEIRQMTARGIRIATETRSGLVSGGAVESL